MTKREKILLQILIGVIVVGVSIVGLLLPAKRENTELKNEYEAEEFIVNDMEMMFHLTGVPEAYEAAVEATGEVNTFFYGKMNSYTADELINGMVTANDLDIKTLTIGEYEEIKDKDIGITVDEEDDTFVPGEYLIGCDIMVTGEGNYNNLLNFIDDLNNTSQALSIKSFNYRIDNENSADSENVTFQVTFTIYGIKEFDESSSM